ncbi:MAG TPA: hypothetical protein PKL30_18670 [Leptospiraceae bacterium]|nr:hypothetical protein [Leptospiraceae bacterium]
MDLFSLVRKYKKEAMEIALEDEYDVKPSESKGVQVQSQLCKRVRNMFTQGKSVKEITTLILQQIGSDFEGLDDNEMYR